MSAQTSYLSYLAAAGFSAVPSTQLDESGNNYAIEGNNIVSRCTSGLITVQFSPTGVYIATTFVASAVTLAPSPISHVAAPPPPPVATHTTTKAQTPQPPPPPPPPLPPVKIHHS